MAERRLQLLRFSDIAALEPPEWWIENHLPKDSFTVIFGPPKQFKSFVALDWALSLAHGLPWLGNAVEQCPVVYVWAEGFHATRTRIEAWHSAHGVRADDSVPFAVVPCPVLIHEESYSDAFARLLRDFKPCVVVLDTVARNASGLEENSARDMGLFVKACDDLRGRWEHASILAVHHAGKDMERGMRGSSAMLGAADAVWRVGRLAKGSRVVELHCEAMKDAAEPDPYCIEWTPEGDSGVLVGSDAKPRPPGEDGRPKRRNPNHELAWNTLRNAAEPLTFEAWRDACGLGKSTLHRAKEALLFVERIRQDGDCYIAMG